MNELILSLQSLEDRVLLSGNVSAQGADIVVVGTIADDFIEVRQIGSELRILVNDFDHGTFQLPTGVIDVASLGGNDNIRFQAGVTVDAVVEIPMPGRDSI